MKIEQLKSNIFSSKTTIPKETAKTEEQQHKQADSIKISSQAQQLSKLKESGKNLEAISEKIKQGYYNSDEVLNKVVDAILKEINSK